MLDVTKRLGDLGKTSCELIEFDTPRATGTPWVQGGLVALECVLRETVPFPVHTMFVAEVVAAHLPETARRPLVKHGPMHALGEPVRRTAVAAAAQVLPDGTLRVAATGPAAPGPGIWRVSLVGADATRADLGEHPSPSTATSWSTCRFPGTFRRSPGRGSWWNARVPSRASHACLRGTRGRERPHRPAACRLGPAVRAAAVGRPPDGCHAGGRRAQRPPGGRAGRERRRSRSACGGPARTAPVRLRSDDPRRGARRLRDRRGRVRGHHGRAARATGRGGRPHRDAGPDGRRDPSARRAAGELGRRRGAFRRRV